MMKLTVLKDNLAQSLALVSRFVAQKAQLPVLSHIVLEAKQDGLWLSATNLETGIVLRVGAKIESEGSMALPSKLFSDLVQSLPTGVISMEEGSGQMKVSLGSVKAKLSGQGIDEFPRLSTQIEGKQMVGEYGLDDLGLMAAKVGFAVSKDVTRPVLTGLLWDVPKKAVVATDGFRLARLAFGFEASIKESLLMPGDVLGDIVKAGEVAAAKQVVVYFDEGSHELLFVIGDAWVVARMLEGDYPAYEAIIPKTKQGNLTVDADMFGRAVKTAALFAQDSAHVVKFSFEEGKLVVSANTPQVGENRVVVDCEMMNGEFEQIAFNSRYLLDFLAQVGSEKIAFEMTEALKPGVFREIGEGSVEYVVMPIRIKN